MKGQMFIVIIVFLAVFVFVIQQLLFQYSVTDVTEPFVSNDVFVEHSIKDTFSSTLMESRDCADAERRVVELASYFNRQQLISGFLADIDHSFECVNWYNYEPDIHPLNITATLTGESTSTEFNAGFYQAEPDCEIVTAGWTEVTEENPGTVFEYSPKGQCRFFDNSDTSFSMAENTSIQEFPENYTFTIRMKLDQPADTASLYPTSAEADRKTWTLHGFFIYNKATICELHFAEAGIYVRNGNLPGILIEDTSQYVDSRWHEWTALVVSDQSDPSITSVTLYRDGIAIKEITDKSCQGGVQVQKGRLGFENAGNSTVQAEMHIATFRLQEGIVYPDSCNDLDDDGYSREGGSCGLEDCNDMDPNIKPSAFDACDNIDNDCDGLVDESFIEISFYRDSDNDGFGNPLVSQAACAQPAGYVEDNTDCDDTYARTYPGAREICDRRDNQCPGDYGYGFVDEGCIRQNPTLPKT